jgi:hypothetical protein
MKLLAIFDFLPVSEEDKHLLSVPCLELFLRKHYETEELRIKEMAEPAIEMATLVQVDTEDQQPLSLEAAREGLRLTLAPSSGGRDDVIRVSPDEGKNQPFRLMLTCSRDAEASMASCLADEQPSFEPHFMGCSCMQQEMRPVRGTSLHLILVRC